ncbi:MAG TPA: hypothetical protein VEU33_20265 [Archangium sp.]|nr:hypothetical protein [Archangium sp.]
MRLRALMSKWTGNQVKTADPALNEDIETATNDALFELIDQELEDIELEP